jgi:hypothetical protein
MYKTTQEYFKMPVNELLKVRNEFTKEEDLLLKEGTEISFFNNEEEFNREQKEYFKYLKSRKYLIKDILLTADNRLAIILIQN